MINLSGCIVLPLGVDKIFLIRKILRFDKSDRYFRFDHRVLTLIYPTQQYAGFSSPYKGWMKKNSDLFLCFKTFSELSSILKFFGHLFWRVACIYLNGEISTLPIDFECVQKQIRLKRWQKSSVREAHSTTLYRNLLDTAKHFKIRGANDTLRKICVTTGGAHWLITTRLNVYWLTK